MKKNIVTKTIRDMKELSRKYNHLGITRWSVYNGQNIYVGHRLVTVRDTGEHLVQSVVVDMESLEIKGSLWLDNGRLTPCFSMGDPEIDSVSRLESKCESSKDALGRAKTNEDRIHELKWLAGYGSVAARGGSAKGAAYAAEAYYRLESFENATKYALMEKALGGSSCAEILAYNTWEC